MGNGGDTTCTVSSMLSYLDASTGSMLMAAVAGGAAGIAVLVRMYWHRFLGVFSKKHKARPRRASAS